MEIIIKKPVPTLKSTYVLIIKYMHGDGDAYTENEFEFKDVKELVKITEVILEAQKTLNPEKYFDVLKKRNLDEDEWCEYFTDDATCQGYNAFIQHVYVIYFDENGIKHETEIKE